MSKANQEMLKSWVKTALAASVSVYMAGNHDPVAIVQAGAISVLPVIYAWLDPKDARFGRVVKVTAKKKAAVKKAASK